MVQRARKILEQVEAQGAGTVTPPKNAVPAAPQIPDMLTALSDARAEEAADRIREVDINTLTPIEAINLVYELKKIVK